MTPPDQPEDAPSALSRLERALAGFGEPARVPENDTATAEENADAAPEPTPQPDVSFEPDEQWAAEPEPELEPEPEPEPDPEPRDTEADLEVDSPPEAVESSSVLDIASALEAVERLSAVSEPGPEPEPEDEPEPARPVSDADARVFATASGTGFDEEDDVDGDVDESVEPPERRVADAALSWNRNEDDEALPYFLVEDGVPAAVVASPALEELRTAQPVTDDKPRASVLRTLLEIPILLIVAAVIAFLVKTFVAQAYYIPSGSMLPQLQVDDRVVVSKLAYKVHDPRRGDIVVFDDPRPGVARDENGESLFRKVGEGIGIVQPSTDEFIKRVIGLPGDTVEGRDGQVYVNGRKLIEPYLRPNVVTSDFERTRVRPGHLYVMGDNRSGSADSRVFGQINVDTIVGRALIKVWPFDGISFL